METRHKAIAIPMYFIKGEAHFLVVHDRRFKEWTFVTGGCKKREVYNPLRCALRELEEETRGVINITKGSYSYYRFTFRDDLGVDNVYHVYLIEFPMSLPDQEKIINKFNINKELMDKNHIRFKKQYDENDFLDFDTISGMKGRSNVWKMIDNFVLTNSEFHTAINSHKRTLFNLKK
jgi:hypothetical protein